MNVKSLLFAGTFVLSICVSYLLLPGCDGTAASQAEIDRLQEENHELTQEVQDMRERLQSLERQLDIDSSTEGRANRTPPPDRREIPDLGDELIQAIVDDNEFLATALVEEGAPVNAANEQGVTALHAAVRASMLELTELLLENGADVRATIPGNGQTPIHWASRIGSQDRDHAREIVDVLLEYGADINSADADGRRPIYYPIQLDHAEWLQFLVSRGANVN